MPRSLDPKRSAIPVIFALPFVLGLPGCEASCLSGEPGCSITPPCARATFACSGDARLELRRLGERDPVPGGPNALGSRGDVLLSNGQVAAVIADISNQNYLDPNGGSLLDLSTIGDDNDGINQVLQVVGILPRDSVHYTRMDLIDERPHRVGVQVHGTLFEMPEVSVHTLYEMRPCDRGVRMRTEIVNASADPQLWALSDGYYWSGREMLPFTPAPGRGFSHPSFNLLTINDAYAEAPVLAASTHGPPRASYAAVGCNLDRMEGFHGSVVSTMGLPRTVVHPRGYLVFERFLLVERSGDVAGAMDTALELRRQLRGEELVTLDGRVEGMELRGEQDASILVSAGRAATPESERVPWTQVVPKRNGEFRVRVPAGRDYVIELHSLGRKVAEAEALAVSTDRVLPALALPRTATVLCAVTDADTGERIDAEVFVVPADEATRGEVAGTLHGQFGSCAPWLGPPHGPSPACDRFLVPRASPGPVQVEMPPGRYFLYAYHGPFFTIERRRLSLSPGQTEVRFALRRLPLKPAGAVSADLHVHGAASFDSSIPHADRVLSFAAADMDVIVATDHDVVHDYTPLLAPLGLDDRMSTVAGVETTGHVLFMKTPGGSVPLVIGHYNFWPLRHQPGLPRKGGPFDELIEPGTLFARVDPLYTGLPVIQLNHPFATAEFGRDLGFPKALGLNLLEDLPESDDGTAAGIYVRTPAGSPHANNSHHAQEVMNGTQNDLLLPYRAFWFYTLSQGQLRTGTANSDSHGLTDNTVGSPRNLVLAGTRAGPAFDVDLFNRAIREGRVLGTNGPVIDAAVDEAGGQEAGFGLRPIRPAPGALLKLEVSAAPWVPVEEIRIVVNGEVVRKIDGAALMHPPDPFGSAGLLRFQGAIRLADLLPPSGDAWLVIEAGARLPLAADLGGGKVSSAYPNGAPDGVPDTTDNNGDGRVDRSDVADGMRTGPLNNPALPTDPDDPRFHFAQVVTGGYPMAFTNPFILDRDGNGRFDAPRTRGRP